MREVCPSCRWSHWLLNPHVTMFVNVMTCFHHALVSCHDFVAVHVMTLLSFCFNVLWRLSELTIVIEFFIVDVTHMLLTFESQPVRTLCH